MSRKVRNGGVRFECGRSRGTGKGGQREGEDEQKTVMRRRAKRQNNGRRNRSRRMLERSRRDEERKTRRPAQPDLIMRTGSKFATPEGQGRHRWIVAPSHVRRPSAAEVSRNLGHAPRTSGAKPDPKQPKTEHFLAKSWCPLRAAGSVGGPLGPSASHPNALRCTSWARHTSDQNHDQQTERKATVKLG
jgi:hypothetical protein